jgi:VanZ family protein
MIARTTFLTLLVIVTVLALYPHLQLPELSAFHGYLDKIGHALGFATLAVLGVFAWQCRWPLIGGLVCYAVILELLQSFSPGREVGVGDALANLFGLAIGFGLAMTVRRARAKSP